MLNTFSPRDNQYQIKYIPVQLTKGTCPDDHHSFYKQQNRWATGSMQLLLSSKTTRSTRLSLAQRICYGSNALYYFYTMTLLLSPAYLLVLALSSQPSSWAFTIYFIPSLLLHYIVEPFVLRRPFAPLATSLVVISNAYTFLQAMFLLIIRKPLGWEATGSKNKKKKSSHFTFFKIVAVFSFLTMYVITLGVLIMNEQFQYGPSLFIVSIFLMSFLAHLVFLAYTLLQTSHKWRLFLDRKFYAAILLLVLTGGVVYGATLTHNEYNIVIRDKGLVLEKQNTIQHSDSFIDGVRRTRGDLQKMFSF
jgi:cellulose synthase (UDP-forming)